MSATSCHGTREFYREPAARCAQRIASLSRSGQRTPGARDPVEEAKGTLFAGEAQMARRYEDDSVNRNDEWEDQRPRNERRPRSDRDAFDPNLYDAGGRPGEPNERAAFPSDPNRRWSGSERPVEGGWSRNRPEDSRWLELRQGYRQPASSPYTPVGRADSTPRGGFAGKGPRGYVRSDERIREDVSDRLSWDDHVDASDITVTVSEGEVTLEGTTPDRAQKRRAEDIAEDVMGVKDVHNRLKSNKGIIQEVGDKLIGVDPQNFGHAGSGTRNHPAGNAVSNAQNHR